MEEDFNDIDQFVNLIIPELSHSELKERCIELYKENYRIKNEISEEKLFDFFMWFRENGENYIDISIEDMIGIYLREKQN